MSSAKSKVGLLKNLAAIAIMALPPSLGWAASSALATACLNTEDSITSTSFVRLNASTLVLHTADLVNGHRYLIMYNVGMGASGPSREPATRVMYGTTEIAVADLESDAESEPLSTRNGPHSGQAGNLNGFYILTANGSDSLWVEAKNAGSGGGASYFSGKCLMSVDLNNLTNNTHYFDTVDNTSGILMSDTTDTPTIDTTLLTDTYTTAAEDYLVLASAEVWDSLNTSNAFSKQCYLMIDGTIQGPADGGKHTWEDVSDFWNWSYAKIHTFTAASHTFTIKIGNVDSTGATSVVYGRRPRIILIRKSAYVDMQTKGHDGYNTVVNDYNTWGTDTSLTYTNNTGTTENVVLLASASLRGVTFEQHTVTRILNNTDALSFSEVGTSDPREANDTVNVTAIGFLAALANGGAKQVLFQVAGDSTAADNTVGFVNLIAWNLKEDVGAPPAVSPKRRRKLMNISEIKEPNLRPSQIAQALGLQLCDCPEDSLTVREK